MIHRLLLTTAVLAAAVAGCSKSEPPPTFAEQYPGPWRDDAPADIIMALSNKQTRGCGEFYYRSYYQSSAQAPEYLVYCTGDGKTWTAYIVWPAIERVNGPSAVSAEIPPPY